jgi:hypothetical protein
VDAAHAEGDVSVIRAVALGCALSASAWAQDAYQALPDEASTPAPAQRPFLFEVDPSLPGRGEVLLSAGLGNVTRSGEQRPIGAGQLVPTLGAEVGLFSHASVYAEGGAAFAQEGATLGSPVSLQVGAHVLLTDPASRHFKLALQAAYGRDFSAASSVSLGVTGAYEWSRLRAAATFTASRTLSSDADKIDLGGALGLTVGLPAGFRVGAEAVATDLEEVADPGAEGGPAAFAGPTVGWEWNHFLQLVAGPAFGVGPGTRNASFLGRAAATIRF